MIVDPIELARSQVGGGNYSAATANALIAIAESAADIAPLLACLDERLEYLECLEALYCQHGGDEEGEE